MIQIATLITIIILYVIPLNDWIYEIGKESNIFYLAIASIILISVYFFVYILNKSKNEKYGVEMKAFLKKTNVGQGYFSVVIVSIMIFFMFLQGILEILNVRIYMLAALVLIYILSGYKEMKDA